MARDTTALANALAESRRRTIIYHYIYIHRTLCSFVSRNSNYHNTRVLCRFDETITRRDQSTGTLDDRAQTLIIIIVDLRCLFRDLYGRTPPRATRLGPSMIQKAGKTLRTYTGERKKPIVFRWNVA